MEPRTVPIVLFANSSGLGGIETHLVQLAAGLMARGWPVAAICSPRGDLDALRGALAASGVAVHVVPDRDRSAVSVLARTRGLIRAMREHPGCIVHMHYGGYGGGELIQLAAALSGARGVVRTEHVPPVPPITNIGRARLRTRDLLLSRVVFVSEQNRSEHLRLLGRDPRRSVVVHNGVDLARFSPGISPDGVFAEFGYAWDQPMVGTVARLAEARKGIGYFLDMAAIVSRAVPDARFLVIGDGPLRPELAAKAHRLGLDRVLTFTGDRADIPRLLSAMRVFVMPSLYEGCQYSLLEALAMARPVVSTPAGVAPAVIHDHSTGLLVPLADADALARGVIELLGDPVLADRLGNAGRDAVVADFSVDAMVDAIAGIYGEIVAPT